MAIDSSSIGYKILLNWLFNTPQSPTRRPPIAKPLPSIHTSLLKDPDYANTSELKIVSDEDTEVLHFARHRR